MSSEFELVVGTAGEGRFGFSTVADGLGFGGKLGCPMNDRGGTFD
jgi:hypothetical protein